MKGIFIGLLILGSISANAKVCELYMAVDLVEHKVILSLEDKDEANNDDVHVHREVGGNLKKLNCESFIREIKESGKRSVKIEGIELPLQLVHTINL